ncbi:MAG: ParB/RepB/Spo0J family partition protein [Candidatus Paceibacterota bacterium]
MSGFYNDSIFWVEVDKIRPNPYQPRKEFNQEELQSLADSIRQYGVLQALVVTRTEYQKDDGGLAVQYELISGERRLRASKLAEIKQVPVIIRTGDESSQMKLELAIIENVQREDLNVVDRARAFQKLIDEFSFSHAQIAKKVGKSREYITNNLRVLSLPQNILDDLSAGKLSEGHARPLMALKEKPDEQAVLHKEILYKKMSVREAERIARKIAYDNTRKKSENYNSEIAGLEKEFSQSLGTRVHIEKRDQGGKLTIDYFSDDDLQQLLEMFKRYGGSKSPTEMMEKFIASKEKLGQAGAQETEHQTTQPTASEYAQENDQKVGSEDEAASPESSQGSALAQESEGKGEGDQAERSEEPKNDAALQSAPTSPISSDHTPATEEPESAPAVTSDTSSSEEESHPDPQPDTPAEPEDDTTSDDDLYSVRNFTV